MAIGFNWPMTNRRLRLVYMGNLFPPGWGKRHVSLHHSCGDVFVWQKLSEMADVSTVGLLPRKAWKNRFGPPDDSPGLEHELVLWDRNPTLWHRWISWRKLRRNYLEKVRNGEPPDVLVIYNLQHVFNHFVKWLRRQPQRPLIVLRIGDSGGLGEKIPLSRRLRYKFKPMQMLEAQSVLLYDACIVSSVSSRRFFEPRGVPWMWHPTTYRFEYNPPPQENKTGPIRFGYFGTLSEGSGVLRVVKAFLKADVAGTLHVCGGGPLAGQLKQMAGQHPNFHFDGFLPKESDCLDWAQQVDVLINSRPPTQGQDNSFPSKVFEYGIAGKAILSTVTGSVREAIGDEGVYFDTEDFDDSLLKKIREMSAMGRDDLRRRGQIIRERVLKEFSAQEQSRRVFEFLRNLVESRNGAGAGR